MDEFLISLMIWFIIALVVMLVVNMIFESYILQHKSNGLLFRHHANHKLFISKCRGNQTGQQATEANLTSGYDVSCVAPTKK